MPPQELPQARKRTVFPGRPPPRSVGHYRQGPQHRPVLGVGACRPQGRAHGGGEGVGYAH
ncbi:MAG: hypothetical protein MZV70_53395 [Desulfobacterales bacterium]|nr:hypothetical protein [Desulfobacterales bacterium]